MSVENKFESLQITAGADFSSTHQHKAVTVGGTVAAAGVTAIGLLKSKPESGEHAQVGYFGLMKAYAGGAINSGTALDVANSGFIVAHTAVGSGGNVSCGRAIDQVASGDLFYGLFNFANFADV
jgi:hypothetical protein